MTAPTQPGRDRHRQTQTTIIYGATATGCALLIAALIWGTITWRLLAMAGVCFAVAFGVSVARYARDERRGTGGSWERVTQRRNLERYVQHVWLNAPVQLDPSDPGYRNALEAEAAWLSDALMADLAGRGPR